MLSDNSRPARDDPDLYEFSDLDRDPGFPPAWWMVPGALAVAAVLAWLALRLF